MMHDTTSVLWMENQVLVWDGCLISGAIVTVCVESLYKDKALHSVRVLARPNTWLLRMRAVTIYMVTERVHSIN